MTRNKLYTIFLIACFTGFLYLFYTTYFSPGSKIQFCIIKTVTTVPCPSCGSTRAVQLISQGRIMESLLMNPFGILIAFIMTVFPVWILADMILRKDTFFKAYKNAEKTIRKPWLAVILILLVILNWIWNIYKHL